MSTSRDVSGEGVQQVKPWIDANASVYIILVVVAYAGAHLVNVIEKSGTGGGQGKRGGAPGAGSNGSLGAPTKGETYAVDTSTTSYLSSAAH